MPILQNHRGETTHSNRKLQLSHFIPPFYYLPFCPDSFLTSQDFLVMRVKSKLKQMSLISWIQPTRITLLENLFRPNLFSHSPSWQNCRREKKNHSCLKVQYSDVLYYPSAFVRGKINKPQTTCCQRMMGQRFILKEGNSKLPLCCVIPKAGSKPAIKTSHRAGCCNFWILALGLGQYTNRLQLWEEKSNSCLRASQRTDFA